MAEVIETEELARETDPFKRMKAGGRLQALLSRATFPVYTAERRMNLSEAKQIVGSIGFPSKMPGTVTRFPQRRVSLGPRLEN